MRVNETITFTREVSGSTGYGTYPVLTENLALLDTTTDSPARHAPIGAAIKRHWTFLAVKEGKAKVQFARLRPWDTSTALYEDVLSIDVEAADAELLAAAKAGGWSPLAKPDADALAAFKEAFTKLLGVSYEPLLVTKQVVNGVYYIFAANAKVVHPEAVTYPVLIRVYKGPNEPAKTVKIVHLGSPSPHHIGGYNAFRSVGDEEKAVLAAAFTNFAGAKYTADFVSTQLVSGHNYRFAGTQTIITQDKPEFPVLFTIYQPLFGSPVFTGAEKVYDLV
jgi:predicted secreted protein